ncbi:MAG: trigger factor [Clostridiales bacterium]|nr:trigger factor [Clostridiales bacterium]
MKCKAEKSGKSAVKLTIEVENKEFLEAVQKSYFRNVKKFNIPGFRKGKAPKNIIERYYGNEIFFEDAVEIIFRSKYPEAVKGNSIEPIDNPTLDIKQIGKDKDLILELEVAVKPEVELGEYMGIEIEKVEYNVTDEDVQKEVETAAKKNARIKTVEDRAIKNDDIATISYKGTIDGVAFEGGSSDEHKLTIGSGEFIEGFEEQLVGAKLNDELKVKVTFPENYFKKELSNKEAVFEVKILKIEEKELPVIDDEFAKDVSEFDTLDEYKKSIRDKLEKIAQDNTKIETENRVIEKVVENATVDIPDVMIKRQVDNLINDFEHRLSHQGVDLNTYLMYTGSNIETLRESFEERAKREVKAQLVIEAITKKENIEALEEEIKEEIENIAKVYNVTEEDFYEGFSDEDKRYVRNNVAVKKCIKILVDNAKMSE